VLSRIEDLKAKLKMTDDDIDKLTAETQSRTVRNYTIGGWPKDGHLIQLLKNPDKKDYLTLLVA